MAEKKSKTKTERTRIFATVVYPESAIADWQEKLSAMCIPCFISPLHDSDINADGKPKKAHYHILFMFDGVKTEKQVQEIIAKIGGVGCEKVNSVRGYARYLCHLDNPDKHQYATENIISLGGANYINVINLPSDKYRIIGDMIDYCEANAITEFSDLICFARLNKQDWFQTLCDNGAFVMREYLKSKRYQQINIRKR